MILIDGQKVSKELKEELKEEIARLKERGNKAPGLVTILVGDNAASKVYVNSKNKACETIGMYSVIEDLPGSISQEELLNVIEKYNNDEKIHGILVQLPLPKQINERTVIEAISPAKDVDGFHPVSVGNLLIGTDTFIPCTPFGIVELIKRYKIETSGKHVVVVGRSNIVGKPVANLLLQKGENANAIVTITHSAAKDLAYYTRQADIIVAAIGVPDFIKADMVKDGVAVIDVGINRVEDPSTEKGYRIVGDVEFESVAPKSSYITPVPGGVGPMTISMLLYNTLKAYKKIEKVI